MYGMCRTNTDTSCPMTARETCNVESRTHGIQRHQLALDPHTNAQCLRDLDRVNIIPGLL